jgi:hypothetical protein
MIPTGPSPENFDQQEDADIEPTVVRSPTYHVLHWDILVRIFYHEDRVRFFLFAIGCSQLAAIFLGTATYAALTEGHLVIRTLFGALALVLQLIAFVFGFSGTLAHHKEKKEKYTALLGDLEEAKAEKDLVRVRKAVNKEVRTESVTYYGVEAVCWNRAYYSITRTEDVDPLALYPIKGWQNRLRNIIAFSPEYFRVRKSAHVEHVKRYGNRPAGRLAWIRRFVRLSRKPQITNTDARKLH